jgi:hypothetical protein
VRTDAVKLDSVEKTGPTKQYVEPLVIIGKGAMAKEQKYRSKKTQS